VPAAFMIGIYHRCDRPRDRPRSWGREWRGGPGAPRHGVLTV